jgi:putative endonuclease
MAKPSTYVAVSPAQRVGSLAESRALDYLRARGLELVAANVRLRCGEIDLIMSDRGLCVFVEVRQRASTRYGGAAASIDARKQARVRAAAQAWLQHRCAGRPWPALRFDVVAIEGSRLHWLPGAF